MTQVIEAKQKSLETAAQPLQALSAEEGARLGEELAEAYRPIAQSWPMKTFAYRNPLRGFEHLPFEEAIRQAKHLLGGNGYLPNADYRFMYRQGRITEDALRRALPCCETGGATRTVVVAGRQIARQDVLRLHLLFGFEALDPVLLDWHMNAGAATRRFRHDLPAGPLYRHGDSSGRESPCPYKSSRKQQAASHLAELWDATLSALGLGDRSDRAAEHGEDEALADVDLPPGRTISDWLGMLAESSLVESVNDQMIKWTAGFVDEGMAGWEMPGRQGGFYQAWRELAPRDFSSRLLGIKRSAKKIRELPASPQAAVALHLKRLGIPRERWTEYLARQLAQLPGWAGFIRWREENPGYPAQKNPIDLVQYLAVRLFYEVELVRGFCRREWGIEGTLPALISYWSKRREKYHHLVHRDRHAFDLRTRAICRDGWRLFHLAQFLELTPRDVAQVAPSDVRTLLSWLDGFPAENHGAVWLDALESSYRQQLIQRLSADRQTTSAGKIRPRAQLVLCIDARSESFRRHIEAQGPYETYGFAGFFGVPIRYQAFDSVEHAALCPVIVSPQFEVNEVPRDPQEEPLQGYAAGSRWSQLGEHLFHDLKRNPIGSLMLIDVLGLFFGLRLIGKTVFQMPYESAKAWIRRWFTPAVGTQIPVERPDDDQRKPPSALPDGKWKRGFTLDEQATFVEKGLRAIGLTENFGRFIVLCGHGSTSENNPYFAAYNCGACGGGHGDPNARIFATMGNQPQVRRILKDKGLDIPDDTWFLAAKHNTALDQVTFYDVQDVPASHAEDLRRLAEDLKKARDPQVLERCRRIPQAPRDVSPQAAASHVVGRSVDWANVRPEWGLSSNAAFIFGRRTLTKDVDLGGRVFLQSYDPDADTEGAILEALMNAPLVVGQWISMEYYFSAVDPAVYGSGSKVTHNVVSGVGVMHGSHGDLQSGLPLQSVNDGAIHYHEPMRLLAIIEAPTGRISAVIQKHKLLQHLFHNRWVHLVAVDPATREFYRYHPDATWERVSVFLDSGPMG